MISKKELFEIIELHKMQEDRLDQLNKIGLRIWDSSVIEYGNIMFEKLLKSILKEEGVDWIYWWLYSKGSNPNLKAFDENHKEIPTETNEDLWNLVKNHLK